MKMELLNKLEICF